MKRLHRKNQPPQPPHPGLEKPFALTVAPSISKYQPKAFQEGFVTSLTYSTLRGA